MSNIYLSPDWFFGYDILLEVLFAIVALLVAIYSFKIYKLSGQRQSQYFGIAFLLIAVSYIAQSLINFLIVSQINNGIICCMANQQLAALTTAGLYIHSFLFIIGITIIAYTTLKVNSPRTFLLLLSIVILALLFSTNMLFMFYLLASVLLAAIVVNYIMNYMENRKTGTLLVLLAMIFLLFSTIHFIPAINHSVYYALGHILELIAYSLILTNLILVLRKRK